MQLQSWSPFLPTFFLRKLPSSYSFLFTLTNVLTRISIYFNTTSFRYLLSTDIYVLSLRSIILWLSPLYLLGDIRDIREKRMKSEFTCMYLSFFYLSHWCFPFSYIRVAALPQWKRICDLFLYILFLFVWFTYFEITQHNFYLYFFHILFSCL